MPSNLQVLGPLQESAANTFTPLAQEIRVTLPTDAAAFHLHLSAQTMRIYACKENGPLRPLRVNGRLHWKTDDIRRLLGVAALGVAK